MKQKAFWGTLLLLTAISLVLYGIGLGPSLFGMPVYKLIFAIILVALIFAKIAFSNNLQERFKIFVPLSFLFMILESDIARWANLSEENIINNWLLFLAAIIADIAIGIIVPKKKYNKHDHKFKFYDVHTNNNGYSKAFDKNIFGEKTIYIDANTTKHSCIDNKFGEMIVYYQNTDIADPNTPIILEIDNKFGELCVHVPENWTVVNEMRSHFGELNIRHNTSDGVKLIVTGTNNFGETRIV